MDKDKEESKPKKVPQEQPNNPLHGVKLAFMLQRLVSAYGWEEMGAMTKVRCFTNDPTIKSSLKFLRRTPWARDKVEGLYLRLLKEEKRALDKL